MASAAAVCRSLVRVVADIARLITLMGSVGVRVYLFGLGCYFRIIAMTPLANRSFNLLARWVFLMAPLALETDLFVFIGQKLFLGRPG